jgi:heat shock protein HslJ
MHTGLRRLLRRLLALVVGSAVAGASLVGLGGCGSGRTALDGTDWVLAAWSVSSIDPADVEITATFVDGQVSGRSAVNTYGGTYSAGPGAAFSVGDLTSTEIAGPEPAMRAEAAYVALLREAGAYRLDGGRLTLSDDAGNALLVFDAGE